METTVNDVDQKTQVIEKLREVYDPEIPVNIYDLGLVYGVAVHKDNTVSITMTLTSPACPVAESMPNDVKARVDSLSWVTGVDVELLWEPPWTFDMMTEAAKLELGFD
jgi:FeS assembly SUF system protein